ncbi:hypothetical protein OAI23_06580, partial [Alphaproteobacteria bacterium]|nr:hypothetical protein [Alphaproteobacteria bacterium]
QKIGLSNTVRIQGLIASGPSLNPDSILGHVFTTSFGLKPIKISGFSNALMVEDFYKYSK